MPTICPELFDSPQIFKEVLSISTASCLPHQYFVICLLLQDFVITLWNVLRDFIVKTIVRTYGYYLRKYKLKIQDQLK